MSVIVGEDEYWYYTANGGMSPRPKDWRTGNPLPVTGRYQRPGQSAGTVGQPSATNTGSVGVTSAPQQVLPPEQLRYGSTAFNVRNAAEVNAEYQRRQELLRQMPMFTQDFVTLPNGERVTRSEQWMIENGLKPMPEPRQPQMMQYMPLRPNQYYGFGQRQPTMQFFGSAPPTFTNPYSGTTSWNYAGLSANPFRNMAGINENMNNILASRLMRY